MMARKLIESAADWIAPTQLKPWADNPRENEQAVSVVVASIKRFGFTAPILVRKSNNEVIAGHTRLKAALILGLDRVPVRFLNLSEGEAHALALADNKIGELADWSDGSHDVLRELASVDVDLEGLGFSDDEVADLFTSETDTQSKPKFPPPKSVSKLGPFDVPGVHIGDAIDCMKQLPDECIDCVVTSPPYWGLRSYLPDESEAKAFEIGAEETPEAFVANMVRVFAEVRRVLKPHGTCWLNLGDCYASDTKGSGGTSTINNSGSRFRGQRLLHGLKQKDLVGVPWRVAFALQADGWYLRSDIIWHKPNPMPESVTDRPTNAHEYLFLLTKQSEYQYDADAVREDAADLNCPVQGDYSRPGDNKPYAKQSGTDHKWGEQGSKNRRSVWTVPPSPYAGSHHAVMPSKLIEPCIKAGCPVDGVVLDPFMGSGTVGKVAQSLGRLWLGFDLDERNAALVNKRIATGK